MNPFVLSFSKHTEFILRGRMEDTNVCGKALWGSTRGGSVSHGCRARGLQCGVPRGMTAGGQSPQSLGEGQGWQGGFHGRGAGRDSGSLSMVSARQEG